MPLFPCFLRLFFPLLQPETNYFKIPRRQQPTHNHPQNLLNPIPSKKSRKKHQNHNKTINQNLFTKTKQNSQAPLSLPPLLPPTPPPPGVPDSLDSIGDQHGVFFEDAVEEEARSCASHPPFCGASVWVGSFLASPCFFFVFLFSVGLLGI